MVNSIKKGKGFEREVAKFLTKITGCNFRRVPMSGAFSTSFHTSGHQFKGDVFTEDEKLKDIVIECKFHKNLAICDFFNPNSKLYDWIRQSINESKGNDWILFFKINNIGTFIIPNHSFKILFWDKIQLYKKTKTHLELCYEPSNESYECISVKNL